MDVPRVERKDGLEMMTVDWSAELKVYTMDATLDPTMVGCLESKKAILKV